MLTDGKKRGFNVTDAWHDDDAGGRGKFNSSQVWDGVTLSRGHDAGWRRR